MISVPSPDGSRPDRKVMKLYPILFFIIEAYMLHKQIDTYLYHQ